MKAKRLLCLLLAIAMCFVVVSCKGDDVSVSSTISIEDVSSQDTTQQKESLINVDGEAESTPLLYRVTGENGNVAWLFGSVHVGTESFYPFPDYVYDAYVGSDVLAVEADIVAFEEDMAAQLQAMYNFIYLDGSKISDAIPQEVYDEAVEILTENGIYSGALDYYCPSFWSNMIDSVIILKLGIDTTLGVDYNLIVDAKNTGKEIVEIESVDFQYKMMANFSNDLQAMLLMSSVEGYKDMDEYEQSIVQIIDAWEKGDEEALVALLASESEGMTEEELVLYDEYNKAVMIDRNLGMVEFVEEALKSDKETFVCVGAAHVVGEGAMVDLLKQNGYTVERVYPTR